ncbi:MAG: ABC transporter permease [Chloroflexota bacterium]
MRYVKQRKILRDLWQNRSRTLLVVLSIAVGVFAFGVIAGARATILQEINRQYLAIDPASTILYIDAFDDRLVDAITRRPDVDVAEGRRTVLLRQQRSPGDWEDFMLFAIPDFEDMPIDRVYHHSGVWPPPDRTVALERKSLSKTNVDVGEALQVEIPGGKQRQLQISGLAHDLSRPPTDISGITFGYITFDTLAWLGLPTAYNELHLIVAEHQFDKAHIEQVAQDVAEKIERTGLTVYRIDVPEPGKHPAEEILPTILLILGILGGLSLILSAFLVINTISAILAQQKRQIGVMKAIGAQTNDITRLYIEMIVVFGLLALFISIPLGVLGARGLSQFISGQLNIDISQVSFPGRVIFLEVAVSLLVPVVASLYPVLTTARLTVREALSDYGLGTAEFGSSLVDRVLLGLRKLLALSRPLVLSLRNTFRRKGRLALTLITLIFGGAIFMSVLTVRASLFNTLDQALVQNKFDILVLFNRPYRVAGLERNIASVAGVTAVEGWGRASANRLRDDDTEGDDLLLIAPPVHTTMLDLNVVDGRWLTPTDDKAIVVNNRFLLDEPDLSLGDSIILKIGDLETEWRIVGITEEFRPPLSPATMYVNDRAFARVTGQLGRAVSARVVTTSSDAATQAMVARRLEEHFEKTGIQVTTITTLTEDRDRIVERFNILTGLLMVMSVLMAVVGGLGLMGTMSINVLERAREIGVIRSIGASDGAVIQLFVVEGLIIGLISWGIGAIFSLPLSRVMGLQIGQALFQMPLAYQYSLSGLGIWLALVIIIAILASFLPAWRASRLTVRAVLAYE